jgi:hypothetical protein
VSRAVSRSTNDSSISRREQQREDAIKELQGLYRLPEVNLSPEEQQRKVDLWNIVCDRDSEGENPGDVLVRPQRSSASEAARRAPGDQEKLGPLLARLKEARRMAIDRDVSMIKEEIDQLVRQRQQVRPVEYGGSSSSGGPPPLLPAKAPPLLPAKAPPLLPAKAPPPLMPPKAPPGQPAANQQLASPPAWSAPGAAHRAPARPPVGPPVGPPPSLPPAAQPPHGPPPYAVAIGVHQVPEMPSRVKMILEAAGFDMTRIDHPETLTDTSNALWVRYPFRRNHLAAPLAGYLEKSLLFYHASHEHGAVQILRDGRLRAGPSTASTKREYVHGIGTLATHGAGWPNDYNKEQLPEVLSKFHGHSRHASGIIFECMVHGTHERTWSTNEENVVRPGVFTSCQSSHDNKKYTRWGLHVSDAVISGFAVDMSWRW